MPHLCTWHTPLHTNSRVRLRDHEADGAAGPCLHRLLVAHNESLISLITIAIYAMRPWHTIAMSSSPRWTSSAQREARRCAAARPSRRVGASGSGSEREREGVAKTALQGKKVTAAAGGAQSKGGSERNKAARATEQGGSSRTGGSRGDKARSLCLTRACRTSQGRASRTRGGDRQQRRQIEAR